jgi:hypothetical protein
MPAETFVPQTPRSNQLRSLLEQLPIEELQILLEIVWLMTVFHWRPPFGKN